MEQIVTQCVPSPRESILKTAKTLVEDTKLLVAGAASTQEKLAQAAHSSAKTITQLTEVVLINAVRDVAKALAELIGATKCAAGKAPDDPSMYQLKSAAKVKEQSTETDDLHVTLTVGFISQ
ncbi:Talin-2 [Xenoophorus captivus]|uniref:Talin-2 n=1 Tax=Xenoophorus captivus TaxID=1517983 RepID=A0ABV0R828_9TELE